MSSGNFRLRFLKVLASLGIGAGFLLSHAETFDTRRPPLHSAKTLLPRRCPHSLAVDAVRCELLFVNLSTG